MAFLNGVAIICKWQIANTWGYDAVYSFNLQEKLVFFAALTNRSSCGHHLSWHEQTNFTERKPIKLKSELHFEGSSVFEWNNFGSRLNANHSGQLIWLCVPTTVNGDRLLFSSLLLQLNICSMQKKNLTTNESHIRIDTFTFSVCGFFF